MKTLPFDLEKALAGEAVVTVSGKIVEDLKLFDAEEEYPLYVLIDGEVLSYTKDGLYFIGSSSNKDDLRMLKQTTLVNGFEIAAPEIKKPTTGTNYFYPQPTASGFCGTYVYMDDEFNKRVLGRGLLYLNREDAIAHGKAMIGIDPNEEE